MSKPVKTMVFTKSNNSDPKLYKAINDIKKTLVSENRSIKYKPNFNNKKKTKLIVNQKNKSKVGKIDGFISRTVAQLQITLSNPMVAMLMAVIIFSVYTHHYNYDASIVKSIVNNLNSTDTTKPLASWIESNVSKFFAIAATIVASMSLNSDVMYSSMVVGTVVILMMPTAPITLYFIIIAFVLLYVKLKAKSDKFIVLVFAVAVMLYYNISATVPPVKDVKSDHQSKPQ